MIRIDRSFLKVPQTESKEWNKARVLASKFYSKPKAERAQERHIFNKELWQQTNRALSTIFFGRCAYCESPESTQSRLLVDHFRPITEASNLDGTSDPDYYWWLAYEPENFYLACAECIQNKSNLFPTTGPRLAPGRSYAGPSSETYLLVDPCHDDPEQHLRFRDDGTVEATIGPNTNPLRGEITIKVLGLNRSDLVGRRKKVIASANESFKSFGNLRLRDFTSNQVADCADAIQQMIDEGVPFAALKRHIAARFLLQRPRLRQGLLVAHERIYRLIEKELKKYFEIEERFLNAKSKPKTAAKKPAVAPSLGGKEERDNVFIKRIEIENFRNLGKLDLRLTPELLDTTAGPVNDPANTTSAAIRAGWKMLLGENATGKSSVLKAVAIALMGEAYYHEFKEVNRLEPERIFNRRAEKKSGSIKLTLTKGDDIEVRFSAKKLWFKKGAEGAKGAFVRAYGSARLFAAPDPRKPVVDASTPLKQVENLFHPEEVLRHPVEWLKANLNTLDSTGLAFRDLLNLPESVAKPLTMDGSEILLQTSEGGADPLSEQSDGYKTVLAFVLDILAGLHESKHDQSTATGIILVDEIDSHLHPRWKMQIVRNLRRTFPQLQFITTTHEPLCLRGLGKGEIAVLRSIDNKVGADDNLPSAENLRIDQLLTSELFGLESTIDPLIDEKFYNYYQLITKSKKALKELGPDGDPQLRALRSELRKYNTLGFTRRDQIVYDLIDEYIAKRGRVLKRRQMRVPDEIKQEIFQMWDLIKTREL